MTGAAGHCGKLLHSRQGGSALEFALVAMPFVLATFASLEFGRMIFYQNSLSSATATSARLFLVDSGSTAVDIKEAIVARLLNADPDRLKITISDAASNSVTFRKLDVKYSFQFILPTVFIFDVQLSDSVIVPLD